MSSGCPTCCFAVFCHRLDVQSNPGISLIKICYLIQRRILIRTKSLKSLHPKSIWLHWSWTVSGVWSANWRRCLRAKGASPPGSRMLQLSWHTSRYFTSLCLNWLIFLMFIFLTTLSFFFFQALLKEHTNDNPKLSYTGKPIVKWPPRVNIHLNLTQTSFCTKTTFSVL